MIDGLEFGRRWLVVSRGSFAAFFACLKPHFPALKIFYDLRIDLRFVCYNGRKLNDMR